jgi:hypothetical protein
MKYRFLLPGVYLLLVFLFLFFFLKGAGGHGSNPFDFVYYLMFPLGFLLELLPGSWGPKNIWLLSFLFLLTGLLQWTLIGYLIDQLVLRRRRRKLIQ